MKPLALLALTVCCLCSTASAAERARIEHVKTEWQNAYGAIIYTVLADVKNVSNAPIHSVRVKVELLDKNDRPVVERLGYNVGAEVLEVVIEGAEAESPEHRLRQVKPIAPGATDLVRISLDKADIGKPFRKANVTIVEVR